jgi:hypothetical protein
MPIIIKVEGANVQPVHVGAVPPLATRVPSKREVLEALATIQRVNRASCPEAFETLRNFILTR